MSLLIVGNSHIVGVRSALDGRGDAVYLPIPLCANFEDAIKDGSGRFELASGWKNMRSEIGAHATVVRFDLAQPRKRLVVVGMKLFGCYPLFRPLISDQCPYGFTLCFGRGDVEVPLDARYQLVSESCQRRSFVDQMTALVESYRWLACLFDSTRWVPSPPPPAVFGRRRFLQRHRWFVDSGLFRTTVRVFNEAIEEVNASPPAKQLDARFLPHVADGIDPKTGFLADAYAHDPAAVDDIHAAPHYYARCVPALTE